MIRLWTHEDERISRMGEKFVRSFNSVHTNLKERKNNNNNAVTSKKNFWVRIWLGSHDSIRWQRRKCVIWLQHNTAHSELMAYRNFRKSIATARLFYGDDVYCEAISHTTYIDISNAIRCHTLAHTRRQTKAQHTRYIVNGRAKIKCNEMKCSARKCGHIQYGQHIVAKQQRIKLKLVPLSQKTDDDDDNDVGAREVLDFYYIAKFG